MMGTDAFCVTPAYSFLLPAYAALWYGGRLYADRLQLTWASGLGALVVALVSASLSFAISNGAFYWLGERHVDTTVSGWIDSLLKWGPLFVRTTMAYIVAALAVHTLFAWATRARTHTAGV